MFEQGYATTLLCFDLLKFALDARDDAAPGEPTHVARRQDGILVALDAQE